MDIQNIDLRRKDFEASHPAAKTFIFNEETMLYSGPKVEILNSQWTTWCACIGIMHFEGLKVQAVPEGFVLVPRESLKAALLWMDESIDCYQISSEMFVELFEHKPILEKAMIQAVEGE